MTDQFLQLFTLYSESGGVLAERYILVNNQDQAKAMNARLINDWNQRHHYLKASRCRSTTDTEGVLRVSLLNMY